MASSVGIQTVIVAAGAFVLGIVIGGIGPRGEVRDLEAKVFELERTKGTGRGTGAAAGEELARLITRGIDEQTGPGASPTTDGGAVPATDAPADTDAAPGGPPASGPDALATAREALEVRRTQARAALVEDTEATSAQLDTVDRVVARMNDELVELAHRFVARNREGGEPSRRDMMAVGADVLDVLVTAEDGILGALTPEQREAVREEATDPTSFVDPEVVEILAELQPPGNE